MIEPYNAVGLIPTFWGIRERADIANNLEHLESLTTAAFWLSNLDIPVRLLVIPEGASTPTTSSSRTTARSTSPAPRPIGSARSPAGGACT